MKLDLETIAKRLSARAPTDALPGGALPRAAVAAIVRERAPGAEPEVLLIQRAEHPTDPWSGHMAFPGGRRHDDDESPLATAMRETREEVGLDLSEHGRLLGRLDDVPTHKTGLVVAPFVFAVQGEHALTFDEREVAEALWTSLGALARGEGAGTYRHEHEGVMYELPCWRIGDRVVWGLTYRMLQLLFEALDE